MFGYIRKFIDEKRETEARIAFRNKMEIIDRMEAYYIAVQNGDVDFNPRYLAIQDFWNAKKSGRLDRLNRIKGRKYDR